MIRNGRSALNNKHWYPSNNAKHLALRLHIKPLQHDYERNSLQPCGFQSYNFFRSVRHPPRNHGNIFPYRWVSPESNRNRSGGIKWWKSFFSSLSYSKSKSAELSIIQYSREIYFSPSTDDDGNGWKFLRRKRRPNIISKQKLNIFTCTFYFYLSNGLSVCCCCCLALYSFFFMIFFSEFKVERNPLFGEAERNDYRWFSDISKAFLKLHNFCLETLTVKTFLLRAEWREKMKMLKTINQS